MKTCIKCNVEKNLNDYAMRGQKHRNVCRKCSNEKRKQIKRIYPILTEHKCKNCNIIKPITEFNKNTRRPLGIVNECKSCRSIISKNRYEKNKQKIKDSTNKYYHLNKKQIKVKRRIYQKKRLEIDVKYKLIRNLRNRLYYSLKNKNWKKNTNFYKYIGCSLDDLKMHIQNKFKDGMNWDNYGEWHIDHIIPLTSAENDEVLYKLCHYTNLQPIWSKDNLKKHSNINYEVKWINPEDTHHFLLNIHYAKRIPQITYAFGLFANEKLVGVITYGRTSSPLTAQALVGHTHSSSVYELNRLCLINNLKNEASILIGRSLKMLPKKLIILSFADEKQKHIGTVYQATNFKYYGMTDSKTEIGLKSDPDKHSLSIYDESRGKQKRIQYLKNKYGDDLYWKKRSKKHRYVFITGKDKYLFKLINYKETPYPKQHN